MRDKVLHTCSFFQTDNFLGRLSDNSGFSKSRVKSEDFINRVKN